MNRHARAAGALFRALVLAHQHEEKTRSLLALVGVALGVAVVVAIALANDATLRGFNDTVEAITGRAQLQVRANGGRLDERLLGSVVRHPGVRHAVPVVRVDAGVRGSPGEVLTVLGVDTLNDAYVRDYSYADDRERGLAFLRDPRAIVVSAAFAARHGLAAGDAFHLTHGGRLAEVRVADILADEGPARALDGNVAIMDIAGAQDRFRLRGLLDTIDIIPADGAPLAPLQRGLAALLPANVLVDRPEQRGATVDTMLAAFRFNLQALSGIALVVGVFLIYNTVSISVVRRRPEIGIARALGARRGTVLVVFLAEGLLFGVTGSLLGCALGTYLAGSLSTLVGQTVSLHWVATEPAAVRFDWVVAAQASAIGILLSLVAAAAPAREASHVEPANTTRPGTLDTRLVARRGWFIPLGVAQLAAAYGTALLPPLGGLPVWGFFAALLVVSGFATLAPALLVATDRLLGPLYGRLFGAEGFLAASTIEGSRSRTTVAVTGLMVGLAMVLSIGIMIGSFRQTVIRWMDQSLRADLVVRAAGMPPVGTDTALTPALAERLARLPGVAAVDPFRIRRIEVDGHPALFGSGDSRVVAARASISFLGGDAAARMRRVIEEGAAVVSETFAWRHGVREGDTIRLPVEAGVAEFLVAGIYVEYSSDLGYIVVDQGTWARHFPGDRGLTGIGLFLEPGADLEAVRAAAWRTADEGVLLGIVANSEMRANALDIFDRTFAVTYALMLIAVVISVLGVTNTLLATVFDRRRELTTLRFLGMSRRRVARVVLLESSLLAIAGTLLGILCGLAISLILIYVINKQSFGWTIQFGPPLAPLVVATLLLYATALLGGVWPAREAARLDLRYR